jgi:WD40 repeat protein
VFSPDGALLACATELNGWGGEPPDTKSEPKKPGDPWWSKIQVWNATTGKELCLLPGHRKTILCVAFSADSNYIASGAEDGAVQIWNVTTQRLVATLAGHKEAVCSVAFSPDGKRLASGAGRYYDTPGEVKVWDVTPYVKLWEK